MPYEQESSGVDRHCPGGDPGFGPLAPPPAPFSPCLASTNEERMKRQGEGLGRGSMSGYSSGLAYPAEVRR